MTKRTPLLHHQGIPLSDAKAATQLKILQLVQETVIAVARKFGEFKADPARGSLSAWLMRLTRCRIADQWRKRQSAASAAWDVGGRSGSGEGDTGSTDVMERIADSAGFELAEAWEQEWETHLMSLVLERVKRQVSPRQFQMFDLHVVQKLSVQEAARTLQASVASVYMAKYRIARLMKKELTGLMKTAERLL